MTAAEGTSTEASVRVCTLADLHPDRGSAVLVGGDNIAVFRLSRPAVADAEGSGGEEVLAIDNRDPFSGANVLARGIMGSVGDRVTVASPMLRQRFDLRTGRCLDDDTVAVRTWPVVVRDGHVAIVAPGSPGAPGPPGVRPPGEGLHSAETRRP